MENKAVQWEDGVLSEILISGSASKQVSCDSMKLNIEFRSKDMMRSSEVNAFVAKECERFLQLAMEMGIAPDRFISVSDETSVPYESRGTGMFSSKREISLESKMDLALAESIQTILRMEGFCAEYNVSYYIHDEKSIKQQLISEALDDARNKAELVAKSMGLKVIGAKKIRIDCMEYDDGEMDFDAVFDEKDPRNKECYSMCGSIENVCDSLYAKLSVPKEKRSEELKVLWLLG